MVIDTSAIVAILEQEEDALSFALALTSTTTPLISTATVVELAIVMLKRRGEEGARDLDELLAKIAVDVVPLTGEHVSLARDGFARFGKGRHPAGLNFGDCFSYALARASGRPLLFKGGDFAKTDVADARST